MRCRGTASKNNKVLQSMSTDEMWGLYEQLLSILARKTAEEKVKLEYVCASLKTLLCGRSSTLAKSSSIFVLLDLLDLRLRGS
jgi:hypothetical protein